MPNYIKNLLVIRSEKVNEFLDKIKSTKHNDVPVDFEKIIEPPLNMFRGNLSSADEARCKEQNIPTWLDWQKANWGTKWNAMESNILFKSDKIVAITFDTAWTTPKPIINWIFDYFTSKSDEVSFFTACEGGYFAERKYKGEYDNYDYISVESNPKDFVHSLLASIS
jgi:hypothetical protein